MAKNSKCTGREKTSGKRDIKFLSFKILVVTSLSAHSYSCFCLRSICFWREVYNSWIFNDIFRNPLTGNRKKVAKFLMKTFAWRSTFLYAIEANGTPSLLLLGRLTLQKLWISLFHFFFSLQYLYLSINFRHSISVVDPCSFAVLYG